MPDNTPRKGISPDTSLERLLEALSSVVIHEGHTLSWYTSKKGRIWVTLKGFVPTVYSTSIELDTEASQDEQTTAFAVLLYKHYLKVTQVEPPLSTWVPVGALTRDHELMGLYRLALGDILDKIHAVRHDGVLPDTDNATDPLE